MTRIKMIDGEEYDALTKGGRRGRSVMHIGALLVPSMIAALSVIQPTKALTEELGFAGVGTQNYNVVNKNAIPGRGSGQNFMTQMVFTWVQGYMSGFNGYSYMMKGRTFDLGSASPEVQWEYVVSFCRSKLSSRQFRRCSSDC
jgi:hypothetical protein